MHIEDKPQEFYRDQFAESFLEFDMSYEGLPRGDRGMAMENLAPELLDLDTWYICHSCESTETRIKLIKRAIKKASQIGAKRS